MYADVCGYVPVCDGMMLRDAIFGCMRICVDVYGYVPIYVDVCGCMMICVDVCGYMMICAGM